MGFMPRARSRSKSHPEIEKTISELKAWCSEERGRQIEIARFLDVSRQLVTDWLSRKANPMAHTLFEIRDFLKAQRGRKK
jgi:transcriptional regulator with XRE-family HTH domain